MEAHLISWQCGCEMSPEVPDSRHSEPPLKPPDCALHPQNCQPEPNILLEICVVLVFSAACLIPYIFICV